MTDPEAVVSGMTEAQWPAVREIYAQGIATGHATFETEPPGSWAEFIAGKLEEHCWVAHDFSGNPVGWVAAFPVSSRCVYEGVVEHSVYVSRLAAGKGVGRELLKALIESTQRAGVWTIESGIFPENARSLAAHRAVGFREVGRRERLGKMTYGPMANAWRDVVLVERRSTISGL
jgi:phosphinothricin acetyltransferase